jgi:hypothetical protein
VRRFIEIEFDFPLGLKQRRNYRNIGKTKKIMAPNKANHSHWFEHFTFDLDKDARIGIKNNQNNQLAKIAESTHFEALLGDLINLAGVLLTKIP